MAPHKSRGASAALHNELKRGSAELLILALLEERRRHGYEIGQLIAQRSDGTINFHVTSLYPTLYRLEDRGWIASKPALSPEGRRIKLYRLTAVGRRQLSHEIDAWRHFARAIDHVVAAT